MHAVNETSAEYYPTPSPKTSVAVLLSDLANHSAALVKNELELFATELHEKAREYRQGVIKLLVGAFVALLAAIVLSGAIINALSQYLGLTIAALLYGSVLLLISSLFIAKGKRELKESQLPAYSSIAD